MSVLCKRFAPAIGCDPEIFATKDGKVVGSERVVPEKGLNIVYKPSVVRDGVQVELNPPAQSSIPLLGAQIAKALHALKEACGKEYGVSFAQFVDVPPEELAVLSDAARLAGCGPSFNIYNEGPKETPNFTNYMKRAGGGHFHLGIYSGNGHFTTSKVSDVKRVVTVADALAGNTFVLLDRGLAQVERRRYYGRAGEYRLPVHGLEYRTLSNFWLRNYTLFDLAASLVSMAVDTVEHALRFPEEPIDYELQALVGAENLVYAINENDHVMALKNFSKVARWIEVNVPGGPKRMGTYDSYWGKQEPIDNSCEFPITARRLDHFYKFVEGVGKNGIEHYFPQDPLTHWCEIAEGRAKTQGWIDYIDSFKD